MEEAVQAIKHGGGTQVDRYTVRNCPPPPEFGGIFRLKDGDGGWGRSMYVTCTLTLIDIQAATFELQMVQTRAADNRGSGKGDWKFRTGRNELLKYFAVCWSCWSISLVSWSSESDTGLRRKFG